ncbi:MAG: phage major capsid protein, partial [Microbacteriaceae bacterium]|nr:phage major capsid protein [Microbacteriaceae bacterium]
MARGEIRSHVFGQSEERVVSKTSTGSPVPTSFYDQVIMKARFVGPMLTTSMMLNTASGENLQIPSLSTYSTSALTGEGTAPSTSDPAFNSFVTLGAYKYAFLTSVSVELLNDSGVDILGFLSDVVGNSIGTAANTALTTGAGTTEPNGIVNQSSVAATATALAITADKLIDLVYSVDTAGRRLPGTGFQMNATQIGKVRQLKDGNGQYIFSPSLSAEQNDILLGYPIYENPAMANA